MKQTGLDLDLIVKRTCKQEFLAQMECVVKWASLVELIAPYYPESKSARPPFALETMLSIYFMQQRFSLSDPVMEDTFFDVPLYRDFTQLDSHCRLLDKSTILRFHSPYVDGGAGVCAPAIWEKAAKAAKTLPMDSENA